MALPLSMLCHITRFEIIKKGKYERGYCSCFIALNLTSVVEKIPLACIRCRLTPNTTIKGLLEANHSYSVGNFVTIISTCP